MNSTILGSRHTCFAQTDTLHRVSGFQNAHLSECILVCTVRDTQRQLLLQQRGSLGSLGSVLV